MEQSITSIGTMQLRQLGEHITVLWTEGIDDLVWYLGKCSFPKSSGRTNIFY